MKTLLLGLFLIPALCFGQETATTSSGKKVILNKDGTWKYADAKKSGGSFSKKVGADKSSYILNGTVEIENGHDDKVMVEFNASVPQKEWDDRTKGKSEKDYFELIAGLLSLKAQYTLKNTLSFEPMKKQFFMYTDGYFMSSYKMMGKNGYGNSIETTALVKVDPEKIGE